MNPHLERQTNIFVVRIWREYLSAENPVLRGEIEDLAHHERHPFADVQELERIVRGCCLVNGGNEPLDRVQKQD